MKMGHGHFRADGTQNDPVYATHFQLVDQLFDGFPVIGKALNDGIHIGFLQISEDLLKKRGGAAEFKRRVDHAHSSGSSAFQKFGGNVGDISQLGGDTADLLLDLAGNAAAFRMVEHSGNRLPGNADFAGDIHHTYCHIFFLPLVFFNGCSSW